MESCEDPGAQIGHTRDVSHRQASPLFCRSALAQEASGMGMENLSKR
jgi:hypothetical protein